MNLFDFLSPPPSPPPPTLQVLPQIAQQLGGGQLQNYGKSGLELHVVHITLDYGSNGVVVTAGKRLRGYSPAKAER